MRSEQMDEFVRLFDSAERAITGNETIAALQTALHSFDDIAIGDLPNDEYVVARNIARSYLRTTLLSLPRKPRTGLDEINDFMLFLIVDAPEELRDYVLSDNEMNEARDALLSIHNAHRNASLQAFLDSSV